MNSINVLETEIKKIANSLPGDFESQDRTIKFAKQALVSCKRLDLSEKQKDRVNECENQIEAAEVKMKRDLKDRETKIIEELKDDRMKARKADLEKHVEVAADAAGILHSDVADHLSPEDVFESTDSTEKSLTLASRELESCRKLLVEREEESKKIQKCGINMTGYKKDFDELRSFIQKVERKYVDIKALVEKYKKKAHADIAQKKREEEEAKRKEDFEKQTGEATIWLAETGSFLEDIKSAYSKIDASDTNCGKTLTLEEAHTQLDLLEEVAKLYEGSYTEKLGVLDGRLKQNLGPGPLLDAQRKLKEWKVEIEKRDLGKSKELHEKLTNFIHQQVMLEISVMLRKKIPDLNELYQDIKKLGDTEGITLENFTQYCRNQGASEQICNSIPVVFNKIAVNGAVLEDEFPFLVRVHYKVTRPTWLTETIAISSRAQSQRLAKGDIVEVLSLPTRSEPSGKLCDPPVRVHVRTQNDPQKEGWVTVTGNRGTAFTKLQTFDYEVVMETVMTDRFEMKGFKVLKRLRAHDKFRALGHGTLEPSSKAMRIKGRIANNPDLRGWVTITGNQGSRYLQPVD